MLSTKVINVFPQNLIARHGGLRKAICETAYSRRWKTNSTAGYESPPVRPKNRSTLKLALIGTTIGATFGTVYSLYNNWKDQNAHKEHEQFPPKIIGKFPDAKITKRYVNPNDQTGLDITLFQFQTCPFCCKVRAFLDYHGISYKVVEVDAVLRQDIRWSDVKKVPTLLLRQDDGRYVQMIDSSAIISLLSTYLKDKRTDIGELAQLYPTISYFGDDGKKKYDVMNKYFPMNADYTPNKKSEETAENERKWRMWVDNHLVHLISPNCYRTLDESFETFKWFSDAGEWSVHFPKWERDLMVYGGATAMWLIAKILKRRHDLSDDVRSHIYVALNKWQRELKAKDTKFMGGKEPNKADLAVYGVLSSMEGCEAFRDCLKNTKIADWYYGVKALVEKNRGALIRERIDGQLPGAGNNTIVKL